MTAYLVYDVFTDTRFGGNPLAIFPDASRLPEDQLQAIAREFNFSETTFVYPPAEAGNRAKVRIFTPTQEVPFAGHPTIGTAVALADMGQPGEMVLELGVGPLACHAEGGRARFTTSAPFLVLTTVKADLTARALGLTRDDICTSQHAPTQASLGLPFVIVELNDTATLSRCTPDVASFREGQSRYPTDLDFAVFAYVRDGDTVHARMFAPLDNIPEDPATGSACATLAALLDQISGQRQDLTIHQGVDMGRPSLITVKTDAGDPMPVTVSGQAVKVMDGTLHL